MQCWIVSFIQSGSPWSCIYLLWIKLRALTAGTNVNNAVTCYDVIYSPVC